VRNAFSSAHEIGARGQHQIGIELRPWSESTHAETTRSGRTMSENDRAVPAARGELSRNHLSFVKARIVQPSTHSQKGGRSRSNERVEAKMGFLNWLACGLTSSVLIISACSGAEAGQATAAAQSTNGDPAGFAHLGLIREALDKVALRPEQKVEVDQLVTAALGRHESVRSAHADLRAAVADQVHAGKVDRAALKPQIDALLAAIDKSRPDDRAALVRLHDLLDKSQREQLVGAIESTVRARMSGHKGHSLQKWAADLNLSDEQRDQIRAALRDRFHRDGDGAREHWRNAHEQGRRLLQSFREDKFSLDGTVTLGHDRMEHGIDRMIDLANVAVPLLRPDQRATAAQKIRAEGLKR
jgi:Spy/CpxP family protein refolding chaperone